MKLTKGKIIAAVAVIAVLAGAFWYGGNAPGLQGWTVQEQESSAVLEAAPPASGPEESIAPIVTPGGEAESPPPTVSGSPVPSETPQETDALAPSPTPGGLDARPGGAEGGMTAREKVEAAAELAKQLKAAGGRIEVYDQNEPMRVKIAKAQSQKIPYMVVLGDKEIENGTVSVRERHEGDLGAWPVEQLVEKLREAAL